MSLLHEVRVCDDLSVSDIVATEFIGSNVDLDLFRGLFARHAAGVAVVTAGSPSKQVGFTATSMVSVSAEPPLLSFNVSRGASSWPTVEAATHVGVHLLAEGQDELATRFSRSGVDRFAEPTRWQPGLFDVPILHGALAWMICRIEARFIAGDHAVIIAEVVNAHYDDDRTPLVYHRGKFTGVR